MKAKDAIPLLARQLQRLEARVAALEEDGDNTEVGDPWGEHDAKHYDPHQSHTAAAFPQDESAEEPWAWREAGGNVEFHPPDDELRAFRERLAPKIGFEHWTYADPAVGGEGSPPLPPEEAIPAFVEGGPAWLIHYDRHFVMSLPISLRQAFVEDIARQSPEQAHEVGRDILYEEQEMEGGTVAVAEANYQTGIDPSEGTSYG